LLNGFIYLIPNGSPFDGANLVVGVMVPVDILWKIGFVVIFHFLDLPIEFTFNEGIKANNVVAVLFTYNPFLQLFLQLVLAKTN
jgi:hypothetical protein